MTTFGCGRAVAMLFALLLALVSQFPTHALFIFLLHRDYAEGGQVCYPSVDLLSLGLWMERLRARRQQALRDRLPRLPHHRWRHHLLRRDPVQGASLFPHIISQCLYYSILCCAPFLVIYPRYSELAVSLTALAHSLTHLTLLLFVPPLPLLFTLPCYARRRPFCASATPTLSSPRTRLSTRTPRSTK